jgi:hypothetical protein
MAAFCRRLRGGVLAAALLAAAAPALAQGGAKQGKAAAPPAKPGEGASADPTAAPEGHEARVEGFRSASFGMNEQQVRAAIRKDFNIAGDKVASEEHPVERTLTLAITVNDLLPETGPARISYILGYKSRKLMQVHVLWGGGQTPAPKPEKLQLAAATLQQYFLGEGFARDKIVANARGPDGAIVVFQGVDSQKRAAVLRFVGAPESGAEDKAAPPPALMLSYLQDPQNPDVFRIAKGQF